MKTFVSVFKKPSYLLLGFLVSIISFVIYSIVPHMKELVGTMKLDTSLGADGSVSVRAVSALLRHTSVDPTFIPTFLLAVLSGIIFALMAYYYKRQGALLIKTSGTGTFGLILGVLGIGCSACGTLALTAVLSLVGLGGLAALLPFNGAEFLYIGVLVMLISVWQIIRLIEKPLVCE